MGATSPDRTRLSVRQMTLTALMTALLCVVGPITLPVGPVPLSLTTAMLALAALMLGAGCAALCCTLYLLMGLIGLPVFSGFTGGIGVLAGPTGGFLLAYLPVTALWGALLCKTKRLPGQAAVLLTGTGLLYAAGCAWYAVQTGASAMAALTVCVLPFLPGDGVKIAAGLIGGRALRSRLKSAGLMK